VLFVKGWFTDSLPVLAKRITELAVLRLDGDMYESTWVALVHLYPKLSVGGWVVVDDYRIIPACRAAVMDFRRAHGIRDPILPIDGSGVYWRRSSL
jgi:hypothetical protein